MNKEKSMDKRIFGATDQWFGYKRPDESPAVFGARTIQEKSRLDFLWDRQGFYGEEKAVWGLAALLDDYGLMQAIKAKTNYMCREGLFRPDSMEEHVLYESWFLKVVASTNASHGYVYLSVYMKPVNMDLAKQTDEAEFGVAHRDYHPGLNERAPEKLKTPQTYRNRKDGRLVWSNDVLPEVGDDVLGRIENERDVRLKVLGYGCEYGYLFCVAARADAAYDLKKYLKNRDKRYGLHNQEDYHKYMWMLEGKTTRGWKGKFSTAQKFRFKMKERFPDGIPATRWMRSHRLGEDNILDLYEGLGKSRRLPYLPLTNFMGHEWKAIEATEGAA